MGDGCYPGVVNGSRRCKVPPIAKVLRQNAWRGLELKGFQVGCSRMCQNGSNQIETHACRPAEAFAEAFVVLPQGFRKAGKHVGNIFFPLTTLGVSPYFPTSLVGEALL